MVIEYEETPQIFDWMLEEVETRCLSFDIYKNGRPFVRMVPVRAQDDVTITDR